MAAIFLAPFYILVNIYVLRWFFLWTGSCFSFFQTFWFRAVFTVCYAVVSTSLLTGFLIKKPEFLRRTLKSMGNYFLGIFVYILMVVFIADIGRIILKFVLHLPWTETRPAFVLSGFICTAIIILLCIYGTYHASQIKVTTYNLEIKKNVPGMESLKLVLFADCHFGYSTGSGHAEKIVQKINEQNADLICIAGDLFDNEYEAVWNPEELQELLRSMKSRFGVYACLGNHDLSEPILAGFTFRFSEAEDTQMKEFLKDSNIHLLIDDAVLIDQKFYLVGREDPGRARTLGKDRKTPDQLVRKLDRGKPIIVLDHQPKELCELAEAGADLDLCGHTHDGQLFPGNIYTRIFWKNSCGYLKKEGMHNVVTSGTGVWGPAMRVGTDNEICVINLSFK